MLLEDANERVALWLSAHPPECLEHRQIRLADAVLLHALSAADAESVDAAEPCQEGFDQRGLSDPRFAGDEDELPLSRDRRREERVQPHELGIAPDERRGRERGVHRSGW